jgi:hypothetical protein
MNCRTGEITNDATKIAEWREAGDQVLMLDADPREMEGRIQQAREFLDDIGVETRAEKLMPKMAAPWSGERSKEQIRDFSRKVMANCR